MKKWWICLFCLLLCPAFALAAVPDEDLHDAVMTLTWPDDNGECWVEGHVVLGEQDMGDTTEVYAQVFYQNYGFMDGVFTDTGGGSIGPRTLIFDNTADGYVLREIIEPEDGAEYLPSIRRMMPESCIHEMNKDSGAIRAEMERQMHKQAQAYLDGIGRSEPIQDWRERDLQSDGMLVSASNMITSLSPPYPLWVTSTERIEDGVRYIYTREWFPDEDSPDGYTYTAPDGTKHSTDGQTGLQVLQKKRHDTGEVVETILIRAELYELTVTFSDAYGELSYTFAYDGVTYRQPELRPVGECRVSYPTFEMHAMNLPPAMEVQQTTAEIRVEGDKRTLVITSQLPNGSIVTTECPKAVRTDCPLPEVDATGRFIRLNYEDRSDDFWMNEEGVWQFSQSYGLLNGTSGVCYDYAARDGALQLSYRRLDGTSEGSEETGTFPLLLMEESFDMTAAGFDVSRLPANRKDAVTRERAQRYVDEWLPEGLTAVSGCMNTQGVGILAENAQGQRLLYVLHEEREGQFVVTEGGQVPAAACWDIHTWNALNLSLCGEALYCELALRPDGETWGVSFICGADWFRVGERYLEMDDVRYYGDHPWRTLETADLTSLPDTFEEAAAQLDDERIAVVSNPEPADRLHLRVEPDRDSRSLGKYYNGTVARLIEICGEWAHVEVGGVDGWMMNRYLAFRDEVQGVDTAFPSLYLRKEALKDGVIVADEPDGIIIEVLRDEPVQMEIIGIVEDEWYHVIFEGNGVQGYVRQECFWEGNG